MRIQPLIVPALLCLVSVTHAGGLDASIIGMPNWSRSGSVHSPRGRVAKVTIA